jgi:acetolactate synthase I/II/III large subunit
VCETADIKTNSIFKRIHAHIPTTDDCIIKEAAKIIKAAKCPLLLIAAGENRKKIHNAFCSFVKRTGIYFFHIQMEVARLYSKRKVMVICGDMAL